ncbi:MULTISPECIES: hypothetical protein [Lacticaseibacillus]|uniref:Uncharacterized protein n=2 Tax=Lacticaseibacillus TaxID=2759736 RepID=A0ABZ0BTM2_LACCA|nr:MULTISPECIES: hypothetical protein [Lacticaseibacillus]WLV79819.1 hypothetical protein LACSTY_001851 [Lacticaseibacillus sp. NCIMB 15473]WNX23779.1 hypothetical protein RWA15_08965 [Lacticaseibacillus casei]WNX26554.1 hypothetical protein RWA16_08970 [Lacticaseibacillus casei]
MGRTYTLAGKQYDYVNKAKDLGAQGRGNIIILQDPNNGQYFCILSASYKFAWAMI